QLHPRRRSVREYRDRPQNPVQLPNPHVWPHLPMDAASRFRRRAHRRLRHYVLTVHRDTVRSNPGGTPCLNSLPSLSATTIGFCSISIASTPLTTAGYSTVPTSSQTKPSKNSPTRWMPWTRLAPHSAHPTPTPAIY